MLMEKDRGGGGQGWSNINKTGIHQYRRLHWQRRKKLNDIKFSLNKEELNLQVKRTLHVPEKFDTKWATLKHLGEVKPPKPIIF